LTTEKVKRKLTAILSADVKGYSRLMGADEVGTIRILQTYRGVMSDLIQKKGGRVVDSPGDNVLAEFASVVDALESAVEIERELKVRNADRSESRRMEFRIGINLGDEVEEGERIYGDGVNIAARIEGLAEVFGMCKAQLEKAGNPLDDFDLVIAASALASNLTLVTNNEKHFLRVEGLKLENWIAEDF